MAAKKIVWKAGHLDPTKTEWRVGDLVATKVVWWVDN